MAKPTYRVNMTPDEFAAELARRRKALEQERQRRQAASRQQAAPARQAPEVYTPARQVPSSVQDIVAQPRPMQFTGLPAPGMTNVTQSPAELAGPIPVNGRPAPGISDVIIPELRQWAEQTHRQTIPAEPQPPAPIAQMTPTQREHYMQQINAWRESLSDPANAYAMALTNLLPESVLASAVGTSQAWAPFSRVGGAMLQPGEVSPGSGAMAISGADVAPAQQIAFWGNLPAAMASHGRLMNSAVGGLGSAALAQASQRSPWLASSLQTGARLGEAVNAAPWYEQILPRAVQRGVQAMPWGAAYGTAAAYGQAPFQRDVTGEVPGITYQEPTVAEYAQAAGHGALFGLGMGAGMGTAEAVLPQIVNPLMRLYAARKLGVPHNASPEVIRAASQDYLIRKGALKINPDGSEVFTPEGLGYDVVPDGMGRATVRMRSGSAADEVVQLWQMLRDPQKPVSLFTSVPDILGRGGRRAVVLPMAPPTAGTGEAPPNTQPPAVRTTPPTTPPEVPPVAPVPPPAPGTPPSGPMTPPEAVAPAGAPPAPPMTVPEEVPSDPQNIERLPGGEPQGQAPVETEPVAVPGAEAAAAGGVVQAPEGEVAAPFTEGESVTIANNSNTATRTGIFVRMTAEGKAVVALGSTDPSKPDATHNIVVEPGRLSKPATPEVAAEPAPTVAPTPTVAPKGEAEPKVEAPTPRTNAQVAKAAQEIVDAEPAPVETDSQIARAVSLARGKSVREINDLITKLPTADEEVGRALEAIKTIRDEYAAGQLTTPDKLRVEASKLDQQAQEQEINDAEVADELSLTAKVLRAMADQQERETGHLFTPPAAQRTPTGPLTQTLYRGDSGPVTLQFPDQEHADLFNLIRDARRAEHTGTEEAFAALSDKLDHLIDWLALDLGNMTRGKQEDALYTHAKSYMAEVTQGAGKLARGETHQAPRVLTEEEAAQNLKLTEEAEAELAKVDAEKTAAPTPATPPATPNPPADFSPKPPTPKEYAELTKRFTEGGEAIWSRSLHDEHRGQRVKVVRFIKSRRVVLVELPNDKQAEAFPQNLDPVPETESATQSTGPIAEMSYRDALQALRERRGIQGEERAWRSLRTEILSAIRLGQPFNRETARKVGIAQPDYYRTIKGDEVVDAESDTPSQTVTIGAAFDKEAFEETAVLLMNDQYADVPAFAITDRASGYTAIYDEKAVYELRDDEPPHLVSAHDPDAFPDLVKRYLLPADERVLATNALMRQRQRQIEQEVAAEKAGVVVSEQVPETMRAAIATALNSVEEGAVILPEIMQAGQPSYPVVTEHFLWTAGKTALHQLDKLGKPRERGGFAADQADDEDFARAMETPGASYNTKAVAHYESIRKDVEASRKAAKRAAKDVMTATYPAPSSPPSRKDTDIHGVIANGGYTSAGNRRTTEFDREGVEWSDHYSRVYVRNGVMTSAIFDPTVAELRWLRRQSATASTYTKTDLPDGVYRLTEKKTWERDPDFTPGKDELLTLLPSDVHGAVTVDPATFRETVSAVLPFAANRSDGRQSLARVLLDVKGGVVRLVATDTHRLIIRELPGTAKRLQDGEYLLSPEMLDLVTKERKSKGITFQFGDGTLTADTGTLIRVEHTARGVYPMYARVVPAETERTFALSAEALRRVLATVAPFADESGKMSLYYHDGKLLLYAADVGRDITKIGEVPAQDVGKTARTAADDLAIVIMPMQPLYDGAVLETVRNAGIPEEAQHIISAHAPYLQQAADAIRTAEVEFGVNNTLSPFTFMERGERVAKVAAKTDEAPAVPFPGALTTFDAHRPMMNQHRSSLPILETALVQQGMMTSTDLQVAVTTPTDLPDGLYQLVSGKGHDEWAKSPYPAEEFPVIPALDVEGAATVGSETLTRAMKRALAVVSDDDARPVIESVLLRVAKDGTTAQLISTDTYLITHSTIPLQGELPAGDYLIPAPYGNKWSAPALLVREQSPSPVQIMVGQGKVGNLDSRPMLQFDNGNQRLLTRMTDGTYPDFGKVMNRPVSDQVAIPKDQLTKALREIEKELGKPGKRDSDHSLRIEPIDREHYAVIGQSEKGETHRVDVPGTWLPGGPRAHDEVTAGSGYSYSDANENALMMHSLPVFKRLVGTVNGEMAFFGITPRAEESHFMTYVSGMSLTDAPGAQEPFTEAEGGEGIAAPNAPLSANTTQRSLPLAAKAAGTVMPRIAPAPIPGGTPKTLRQITLDLSKAIQKSIRVGKTAPRSIGTYYPASTDIVIRFAGNLSTTAHEVAHYLDDLYNLVGDWNKPYARSPYDGELSKFWPHGSVTKSGPRSTLRYKRAEGVAEFVRAWIINPDEAVIEASHFYSEIFTKKVPVEVRTALRNFGDDIRRWAGLSPIDQLMANVEMVPEDVPLLERLMNVANGTLKLEGSSTTFLDLLQMVVGDDYQKPLLTGIRKARELRGVNVGAPGAVSALPPSQDPEVGLSLLAGGADRFNVWMKRNVPRLLQPFSTRSLGELSGQEYATVAAMIAQRTLEKGEQFERESVISGIGAGLKEDTVLAQEVLDFIADDPDLQAVTDAGAEAYRAVAHETLQDAVDMGLRTQEWLEQVEAGNQYYVAMYRLADEDVPKLSQVARGMSKRLSARKRVVEKMKGSTKRIENPYIALLRQAQKIRYEARKNKVLSDFVKLLDTDRGMYQGDPIDFASIGYRVKIGEKDSIRVFVDGEEQAWKFDYWVQYVLNGLSAQPAFGTRVVDAVLTFPRRVLQAGVTHMPDFLIRNMFGDIFHRSMVSEVGTRLGQGMRQHVSEAELDEFKAAGGGQFGYYLRSEKDWIKAFRQYERDHVTDKNVMFLSIEQARKLGGKMEEAFSMSEIKGRLAENRVAYRYAIDELGYSPEEAQLFAAYQARTLMDFKKGGIVWRFINKYVAFINPAVVAMGRTGKAAFTSKTPGMTKRFWLRWLLYLAVPSIMAWLWATMSGSLDEYRELPAYLRDGYWNFKVAPDLWIRIRKPWTAGVLATGAERMLDRAAGNEHAFDGWAEDLFLATVPADPNTVMLGPFRSLLEIPANYDFFRNQNIIPQWEQGRDVVMRDTSRASGVGKAAQRISGNRWDPRMVDYFLRTQFGGAGRYATEITSPQQMTRTRLLNQLTGSTVSSPMGSAQSVRAVMDLARRYGWEQSRPVKNLRNSMQAYYNAKSAVERDRLAAVVVTQARDLAGPMQRAGQAARMVGGAHNTAALARVLDRIDWDMPQEGDLAAKKRTVTKNLIHKVTPEPSPAYLRARARLDAMKK